MSHWSRIMISLYNKYQRIQTKLDAKLQKKSICSSLAIQTYRQYDRDKTSERGFGG